MCGESPHRLHSDKAVAAPQRHFRAEHLRELLAGDAKSHLQSRHRRVAYPQDSSFVEYNDRKPNENFAREITRLFVWV